MFPVNFPGARPSQLLPFSQPKIRDLVEINIVINAFKEKYYLVDSGVVKNKKQTTEIKLLKDLHIT